MTTTFSILIPLVWCGLLAGISFIEAPLKFRAPGITVPLGVGIGRLVFRVLNRVEWGLLLGWLLVSKSFLSPIVIGLLLLLQTVWWLPHLDRRAKRLQEGLPPTGPSFHFAYATAEVLKCLLLVIAGYNNIAQLINQFHP